MIAVGDLLVADQLLQRSQCRRHALRALAELDEMLLDLVDREAGLLQPRPAALHVPAIERDLLDVVAQEQLVEIFPDVLVLERGAWDRLQQSLRIPHWPGDAIGP